MELGIRSATPEDAPLLRDFATKLFAEGLPGIFRRPAPTRAQERAFIASRLGQPNSALLVAEMDGRIVGLIDFVGGTLEEEAHAGTFGLSVDRELRDAGIGTALIEALLEWAPQHGVTRVQAWAWMNNPRAIALYERLGFEREGLCRSAVMVDGEAVDVVLLARLLTA